MNDKLMREECNDCQKLVREYKEDRLSICVRCGHYFYSAECDCSGREVIYMKKKDVFIEKMKKDEEKIEYAVTITMQFTHAFTQKEVDEGTEIPHESIVAGCVVCLANKEYSVQEDEMK